MIRRLTQLHENETLIRAAQTAWGRIAVWLFAVIAGVLLWSERQQSLLVIPGLTLVMLFPERRRPILSLTAVVFGLNVMRRTLGPELNLRTPALWPLSPGSWLPTLAASAAVLLFLYLSFLAAKHFARLPALARRFPQIVLHVAIWTGFVLVWTFPGRPILAAIVIALSVLAWRIGYMLLSGRRGKASNTRFSDHLFYLWPVFGASQATPFGKGFDHLSSHESRAAADFARSQLAGLKLLVLAGLWAVALSVIGGLVYGEPGNPVAARLGGWSLGIPHLRSLVAGTARAAIPIAWLSLYVDLVRLTLVLAVKGHVIIGCLRLFGFHVFRNTYKPLLSESIVDFWGRYHYYFKELLVEFFFYPCYLRHFKSWPRLRLFAAVFAAAFAGNMYVHVLIARELAEGGLYPVWVLLHPRLFYCLLLSLGIWISMLRQQRSRGTTASPPSPLVRLARIAGVWTFFSIIHIWNIRPQVTLPQCNRFLLSLFGF